MAKKIKEAEVSPVDSAPVEDRKPETDARRNFKALIEAYKKQNPKKYALKEAELQRKLDAIK